MATGARLVGGEQLRKDIAKLSPKQRRILDPALLESGLLVLRIAAQEKIRRGGQRTKGVQSPAIQGKLTSRTGTLRRSLGPTFGVDRSGLRQGFIEVGSELVYAPVHEFGNATHPPRPFLSPALDDSISSFRGIFLKHWDQGTRR